MFIDDSLMAFSILLSRSRSSFRERIGEFRRDWLLSFLERSELDVERCMLFFLVGSMSELPCLVADHTVTSENFLTSCLMELT